MGYAEERIELLARLRRQAAGRPFADALRLDGRRLRFHLGTSLADLRVPVYLDASLRDVLRDAVRDLFFLLCMRHRTALRENEFDRLLLVDGFDPRAGRPPAFSPPPGVASEAVRKAFVEAPELHPALDSGVWASWISSGRPGRVLAGALTTLLRTAAEEGARDESREPTAWIFLLTLRQVARGALEALAGLPVSGSAARALPGAVSAGVLLAVRTALRQAGIDDALCEAAADAPSYAGSLRQLFAGGLAAYGVAFGEPPAQLEALVQQVLSGASGEALMRQAALGLASSREPPRKAARAVGLARLRGELLQLLRLVEAGRAPVLNLEGLMMHQLFGLPGALERVLATPAMRKDLVTRAQTAARGASHDGARALLESVAHAGREWKDDDPQGYVSSDTLGRTWAQAAAALAADVAIDRALEPVAEQLVHRTGQESEGGISTQYEAGKLYLFSLNTTAQEPVLRLRARSPQMAHLFCDIKDFTKRTAFLKETVVADFLAREFYGPILTAAARHAQGAAHLADKGGIYLNNLLGDAVSFSGDVTALVALAEDIRRALESYARRLANEASSEVVARTIRSVEEKFRARSDEIARGIATAEAAAARNTLDPLSGEEPTHRLRQLHAERQKLEEERDAEVALAAGEKLEAGIFISFGAAPEVALFEDHVFGSIRVSIAEKINESARGTARNGGVRARVDALIQRDRARRGRPELVCPFQVAISQPLSISVPADLEVAVRQSASAGDVEGAEMLLGEPVRHFIARLSSQESYEDRGDIYNGGAALSEEALRAYVQARKDELLFLRRELDVAQLDPRVREKFIFPMPTLRLVLGVSAATETLQQLFVYAGRALFKGFEKSGGLGVYEMIAREHPFFLALAEHHVAAFLRDDGGASEAGELRAILPESA